jgi:phage head maturation protease
MSVVLQGVATEFEKFFFNGDEIWYLKAGCFGSLSDSEVKLMFDHDGKSIATTNNRLQVHVGNEALIFRLAIPDSFSEPLLDQTDEFESYIPVSVGFTATKTETMMIEGVPVKIVVEATLNEISVLSKEPAVKTTYARIASEETCGSLEKDYERIRLVGRFVSLHRAQKATENEGKVEYKNTLSPYDAAGNRFVRALNALI